MTTEAPFDVRFEAFSLKAHALEEEGVPFPTATIRAGVAKAFGAGDLVTARHVLSRAERLLVHTQRRWDQVKESFAKLDRLRATAEQLGIEVSSLDTHVGNPRDLVRAGPFSDGLFDSARAMATDASQVLEKAIPQFCSVEARKLGEGIQGAKRRGEDVRDASRAFRHLLQGLRTPGEVDLPERLAQTRRAVAQIPRAPAMAFPSSDEEDEILLEARILARRIHRIKRNARDAQSAARLMTHVRAALSEDRRYGTPQEEIEELWDEVARLTKEHEVGEIRSPAIPPSRTSEVDGRSPYPSNLASRPKSPPDGGRASYPLPAIPSLPVGVEPSTPSEPSRRRLAGRNA